MASMATLFLFFSLTSLFIARAQERAPHGIVYENPVAFSPSAVEFFHPKMQDPENTTNPCAETSSCSPLPLAAHVEATPAQESKFSTTTQKGKHGLGAGGVAGIVFGLAFAVFLAMAVYHVLVTRRANVNRANSVQSDA